MIYYSEGWPCIVIPRQFATRKQHSNVRLLHVCAAPNRFDRHANVWHLRDPLNIILTHRSKWKLEKVLQSYMGQIVTDAKSCKASQIWSYFIIWFISIFSRFSRSITQFLILYEFCSESTDEALRCFSFEAI